MDSTVLSVPSPSYPSARDDISMIAALERARELSAVSGATGTAMGTGTGDGLVDMLCPFQLLYSDRIES